MTFNPFEFIYYQIIGPRVLETFHGTPYELHPFESIGNGMVHFGYILFRCFKGAYLIPLYYLCFHPASFKNLARVYLYYVAISLTVRAVGRILNPHYRQMLNVLADHRKDPENTTFREKIMKYDIDLAFIVPLPVKSDENPVTLPTPSIPVESSFRSLLSAIAIHAFGRRMVYPASVSLFQALTESVRVAARHRLMTKYSISRTVLQTSDKNFIDVAFLDNRGKKDVKGKKLVIVCDGNAGTYEAGMFVNFVQSDYSVIGWNPPGYPQCSGEPFPQQILNAANSLMLYCQNHLGFKEMDIAVYGWSIGGFPAAWLASNYPQVDSLILDATFDNLLPLARHHMPDFAESIVDYAVVHYFNMPIADMVNQYKGPVKIVRRMFEEIITTGPPDDEVERRNANRANFLLISFLKNRYSYLNWNIEDDLTVSDFLDATPQLREEWRSAEGSCSSPTGFSRSIATMSSTERINMIRRLAAVHFEDVPSGHNVPLPLDVILALLNPSSVKANS